MKNKMGKDTLKNKLNEVRAKIKSNSKDAHFADTLLDELLSIKGQIDVEPTLVYLKTSDIAKEIDGETFTMAIMKNGDAVYHVKGGYTIVADGTRMFGLAQTIKDYVENKELVPTLTKEERELYDIDLSATTYVLNVPMFAFSDQDLKFDIATMCLKWINDTYDKYINEPLQEETPELDAEFEDAAIALETIKDELKKQS